MAYNREWARNNRERSRDIKARSADKHREHTNAERRKRGAEGEYAERWLLRRARMGEEAFKAEGLAARLKRKYNLTPQEYDQMLAEQGGVCGLCGKTPEQNGRRLAVDHDHACCPGRTTCGQCIRGLLCTVCNNWLGVLENPEWMALASAYLASKALKEVV